LYRTVNTHSLGCKVKLVNSLDENNRRLNGVSFVTNHLFVRWLLFHKSDDGFWLHAKTGITLDSISQNEIIPTNVTV